MTTFALLLGNAQDAGLPQAGCACANCDAAWADPGQGRAASALALVDSAAGLAFIVDATPDFRGQLRAALSAAPGLRLGGLLITHAHMGHYTGLIHLGFEAMAASGVPLFGSPRLLAFLRTNAPWRQLVEHGNLALRELDVSPGAPELRLTPSLSVTALPVPHRAEWSDTLAFTARGPSRRLLYLPDIDAWEAWAAPPYNQTLAAALAGVDVALLDGSFYGPGELPGRDTAAIGHPLVSESAERIAKAGAQTEVRFIHLNHTNPLHRPGPERDWLAARGLQIGQPGDHWTL